MQNPNSTGSLEAGDVAAAAVQKTPFRVTLDYLLGRIIRESYWNPAGSEHVTICALTVANGFVVLGQSAPADPCNFDAELGRKFAREDAVRKLWPLEGYLLAQRLHDQNDQTHAIDVNLSYESEGAATDETGIQFSVSFAEDQAEEGTELGFTQAELRQDVEQAVAAAPGGLSVHERLGGVSAGPLDQSVKPDPLVLPTIGRMVHVRFTTMEELCPAIVTGVFSDGAIDCTAFLRNSGPVLLHGVQPGVDDTGGVKMWGWKWPDRA